MKPPPNWLIIGVNFFGGVAMSFGGLVSLARQRDIELSAVSVVLGIVLLCYAVSFFLNVMLPRR